MKKKRTKKVQLPYRILSVVISFQLLIMPIPISATTAGDVGTSLVNIIGDTIGSYFSGKQATIDARIQAMQAFNINQALTPVAGLDPYFPQCRTLPTISSEIEGMCKAPFTIQTPQELSTVENFKAASYRLMNEWERFANENVLEPGIGASCLRRARGDLGRRLQQRSDALTQIISDIEQNDEIVKHDAANFLNSLQDSHALINGKHPATKSMDQIYQDIARKVGPHCKSVIHPSKMRKGLQQLKDEAQTRMEGADRLLKEKKQISKQINDQAIAIAKKIKQRGVGSMMGDRIDVNSHRGAVSAASNYTFAGFNDIFKDHRDDFKSEIDHIRAKLRPYRSLMAVTANQYYSSDVINGYGVFDTTFSSNTAEAAKHMESNFRRNFLNSCMQGADHTGIGISNDRFFMAIDNPSTKQRISINRFRARIRNIIDNNNLTPEQKRIRVAKLERSYGGRYVIKLDNRVGGKAAGAPWSLSELLRFTHKQCRKEFNRGRAASSGRLAQRTPRQAINDIKKYLQKMQNAQENFSSELAQKLVSRVKNCQGIPYSKNPESCNASKLNPSSPQFCLKDSLSCAQTQKTCYQAIQKAYAGAETHRAQMALAYNEKMKAYKQFQLAKLEALKSQMREQALIFASVLPEAKFTEPEGLFVPLGAITPATDKYGVALMEGGNPQKAIAAFKVRLQKIKKAIDDQNQRLLAETDKHAARRKQSFDENYAKWQSIHSQCESLANNHRESTIKNNQEAYAQQMQMQQKAQQEHMEKVGEVKKKFAQMCTAGRAFLANPACELDALEEAANDAAAEYYQSEGVTLVGLMKRECSRFHAKTFDEEYEQRPPAKAPTDRKLVARLCDESNGDSDQALESFGNYMNNDSNARRLVGMLGKTFFRGKFRNYTASDLKRFMFDPESSDDELASALASANSNDRQKAAAQLILNMRKLHTTIKEKFPNGGFCGHKDNLRDYIADGKEAICPRCDNPKDLDNWISSSLKRKAAGDDELKGKTELADISSYMNQVYSDQRNFQSHATALAQETKRLQERQGDLPDAKTRKALVRYGEQYVDDCETALFDDGRPPHDAIREIDNIFNNMGRTPAGLRGV